MYDHPHFLKSLGFVNDSQMHFIALTIVLMLTGNHDAVFSNKLYSISYNKVYDRVNNNHFSKIYSL